MSDYIIDVKGLRKKFGDKEVVCGIDLQVKPGEIFGFLGPNGSGKTTSLRMICGLLKIDGGEGQCMGYDIRSQAALIKLGVGYMTQKFSLYSDLTIEENLNFVARAYSIPNRSQKVLECMERLGLSRERGKQLAGNLSGGWKQRLALAACLLHEPKVLLLDEPTAGVDPKARREFWETIGDLSREGITTLVTTHYMDEAERCHNLAYVAYGHLLMKGTIKEILQNSGLLVYTVSGKDLNNLMHQLRQIEGVSASAFGNKLHVVSDDEGLLKDAIKPYEDQYSWVQSEPTLEDVFIKLVGSAKDNFEDE